MGSRKTRSSTLSSLGEQLRVQAMRTVMFHSAVAAHLRIATTDLACLNLLSLVGAATPGRLAAQLGLTRGGAVTAMIDRLERAGYVRRERDPADRRQVLVQLDAEVAARQVSPRFADFGADLAAVLDGYTAEELDVVLRFTADVNDALARSTDRLRG